MFCFVLAALLASSTVAAPSASVQWPDIFEPCPRNSHDFEGCAKHNIQRAMVDFSAGVTALGVPPFDPLFTPEVMLNYKQGDTEGNMIIKNSKFYGLKDAEILDFRANLSDPSNLVIDVDYRLPTAFVEGEYKAHGKIVGFPIGGKGVYNISMRDVTATCGVRGDLVTIDGEQYLKVRHVIMLPEVGDLELYVSDLFTGSDELNKIALQFANLYWRAFYKELLPYASEGWDEFLRGILNKMFLKVPFRTIFPEN